jgi:hypothetical protein
MSIIKKYMEYVKDNPEGLWFKRKVYGWGWTPVKWQGWLVILVYVALILTLVLTREEYVPGNPDSGSNFLTYAGPIIVLTIILIGIAYKKGERPHWQWGLPKSDE